MNETALAEGIELLRRGEYFAAHEELETAWRSAEPAERDFCQGLVHVAVAWYQAGRGRPIGCGRQLEKARRRLTPMRLPTAAWMWRPFSLRWTSRSSASPPARSTWFLSRSRSRPGRRRRAGG